LINPTQHAYFNLEGNESYSVLDHYLEINAEKFLPVNEMQVPTGEIVFVEETAFDFRESTPIGNSINSKDGQLQISGGYDHSWVLEEHHSNHLKHAASVYSEKTGIRLDVYTTEPALHFYSGNFLNIVSGKANKNYPARSGLCLETQHFPDATNHQHFPSIVLRPDTLFKSQTIFQISVS
jgi:aldose 1-epimerase